MRQWSLQRWQGLLLLGGYLFLALETLLAHTRVRGDEPLAWLPPVWAILAAAVLLLVTARWTGPIRWLALVVSAGSVVVGLVGLGVHGAEHAEHGRWLGNPPLLAPAAFAGLGLLGLLTLWPGWPEARHGVSE